MMDDRINALITGFRMSLCGLLCFIIYKTFHLPEGFWAVVTVSAITRPNLSGTYIKAMLRLGGTLLGACIGFSAAMLIGDVPWLLFAVILCFTTATTYFGLETKPYDYFSTVAGFSTVIVIEGCLLESIERIALYRTAEVCLGILIMTLVSYLMANHLASQTRFFDNSVPKKIKTTITSITWSRLTLIRAFIIGLTASLTFLSWMVFRYPQGIWVTITVLVIMEDSLSATNDKAFARFLGQIFAAIIGGLVAICFPNNIIIVAMALTLGFFICGVIIGGSKRLGAMGNHAGSALAIMLLSGYPDDIMNIVLSRFFNVLAGIIIATLVSYFLQSSRFKKRG